MRDKKRGGANFTPQLIGYNGQGKFRFWCQKVLPLVYDDSMSYYELLNKVVDYLNHCISDIDSAETNVDRLLNAYNQLQGYVNSYFDSLDVQEAIDTKLDEMVESGEFEEIINDSVLETTKITTERWLDDHLELASLDPPIVLLDGTLSVSEGVAEASNTGASIQQLSDLIALRYDSTKVYKKGEYCTNLHDSFPWGGYTGPIGNLQPVRLMVYKCNVDMGQAEAWNPIHWDRVIALEELVALKEYVDSISGLSDDVKTALLNCFEHVAWVDEHGQDYYDDLYDALYPSAELLYIDAVLSQGSTVVYPDTSLDELRSMLTVTAYYDDNTSAVVTNYALSGNLSVGNSDVTVTYNGKTDVVTVVVTARPELDSISAVFNQGQTVIYDTNALDSLKSMLTVTAHYSDSTTETITDYTLSGTLVEGTTSTITVYYNGLTTTFDVVVASNLLYSLENQSVSSGDMIDSHVNVLENGVPITILLDFTPSALPTTGNGSTVALIAAWSNGLSNWAIRIGKGTGNNNAITGRWLGSYAESMGFEAFATNARNRFAVVHEANSNTITVYHKKGNGTKNTWTKTEESFVADANLVFGSQQNGASSLCTGTISGCYVYRKILTAQQLDTFFG